jgi:hypothetical protein
MEMPLGDVADRLTILLQKFIHGKREGTCFEIRCQIEECLTSLGMDPHLSLAFMALLEANVTIWWLETDLRNGKEGTLPLEEVGRRAIQIRNINKDRITAKNHIADAMGEIRLEVKVNHASA